MALATVRRWALAALALLAPGPAERGRPYAVLQKQNLGKSRRPVAGTFLLGVNCFYFFSLLFSSKLVWGRARGVRSAPNLPPPPPPQCCWAASSARSCSPSSSWPSASTSRSGGGSRAGCGGSGVGKRCPSRPVLPPGPDRRAASTGDAPRSCPRLCSARLWRDVALHDGTAGCRR